MIDFNETSNLLLVNPKLALNREETLLDFEALNPELKNHFFIATSGSVSENFKWVALSRDALLCSARSVNRWIEATPEDVWLQSLPEFHIGGLSIQARAYVAGSRVESSSERWSAESFVDLVSAKKCTLASLVPTQLYDLVEAKLVPPKPLRGIFVGGGALSRELFNRARQTGWPLYVTYGCSEAASQVATSRLNEFETQILDHVEVSVERGRIALQGESLLTGYFVWRSGEWVFEDPKQGGRLLTDDLGEVAGERLKCLGRETRVAKILGENVNFDHLQTKFEKLARIPVGEFALVPRENSRSGAEVVLISRQPFESVIEEFNRQVLPFEKIVKCFFMNDLPKTELGKIKYRELIEKVNKNEL